eukprot:GHVR01073629.1.p1 GENE.GHVR01073629.1~~GHVR01073629.1.p1  ORF type:complete len:362 (+),score=40.79 GHVR01073629.1:1838-2923(+)
MVSESQVMFIKEQPKRLLSRFGANISKNKAARAKPATRGRKSSRSRKRRWEEESEGETIRVQDVSPTQPELLGTPVVERTLDFVLSPIKVSTQKKKSSKKSSKAESPPDSEQDCCSPFDTDEVMNSKLELGVGILDEIDNFLRIDTLDEKTQIDKSTPVLDRAGKKECLKKKYIDHDDAAYEYKKNATKDAESTNFEGASPRRLLKQVLDNIKKSKMRKAENNRIQVSQITNSAESSIAAVRDKFKSAMKRERDAFEEKERQLLHNQKKQLLKLTQTASVAFEATQIEISELGTGNTGIVATGDLMERELKRRCRDIRNETEKKIQEARASIDSGPQNKRSDHKKKLLQQLANMMNHFEGF